MKISGVYTLKEVVFADEFNKLYKTAELSNIFTIEKCACQFKNLNKLIIRNVDHLSRFFNRYKDMATEIDIMNVYSLHLDDFSGCGYGKFKNVNSLLINMDNLAADNIVDFINKFTFDNCKAFIPYSLKHDCTYVGTSKIEDLLSYC